MNRVNRAKHAWLAGFGALALAEIPYVHAQSENAGAERVNVDQIKEKYWAQGKESDLSVVQNRTYTKAKKVEFGLLGGVTMTDPFLNVQALGGKVGFHFNEYLALHVLGWKYFVSPSTALQTFEETLGATTNNNPPRYFVGSEAAASLIYGKLSLVGKAIIYYDMHLLAGAGLTGTDSGKYFTPNAGLGQQVFLNQWFGVRVDYRALFYREKIVEKVIPTKLGQVIGSRNNWTHQIVFGVDFFIGFGGSGGGGQP